jgi:hypothetical protein
VGGCLRRIGCLLLVLAIAAAYWLYQEGWIRFERPARRAGSSAAPSDTVWQPLTAEGATRARQAIERLGQRSGPVFANLSPGDLAAYVFDSLSRQFPPSAEDLEAAVVGEQLHVRGTLSLADLGGTETLGPLAGMLGDRERVQFGGRLDLLGTGLAQYHVQLLKVRDFKVPERVIPRLLRNVNRGARPDGLAEDALPLSVPRYIGDVRIGDGKVTVYKVQR